MGKVGGRYADVDIKRALIDETTAAENEIVAAVAGKIIRVLSFSVVTTLANVLTWRTASTDLTGPMPAGANGEIRGDWLDEGHFETVAGEALNLNSTVATAHGGWVNYVEI